MKKQPTTSRYFRHVNGFGDKTRAMEWDGTKMWIHPRKGPRRKVQSSEYTLKNCMEYVREGVWEELATLPRIPVTTKST